MIRSLIGLLTLGVVFGLAAKAPAGHDCVGAEDCGCHVACPECHHYCKLSIDTVKVENYCWEVECKLICIPRVHFPWDCGRPPKCAKVKHVNVLKKKEYECERCEYTWTPEPAECGSGSCGTDSCDGTCGGGCDVGYATSVDVVAPADLPPQAAVDASTTPQDPAPLTGQRPTWFHSAKSKASSSVSSTVALPTRFLRAARRQASGPRK